MLKNEVVIPSLTRFINLSHVQRPWCKAETQVVNYISSQGAKKVGFMACHLGKLLLVSTSPTNFLMSSIDYSSSVF